MNYYLIEDDIRILDFNIKDGILDCWTSDKTQTLKYILSIYKGRPEVQVLLSLKRARHIICLAQQNKLQCWASIDINNVKIKRV